jgi:hypothetical protein
LLNSRQGHFSATPTSSASELHHRSGRSFSRSYGSILPSSLTRVLPIALGFSPRPPVSVCGTGTWVSTLRGFSRQHGLSHISRVTGITHSSDSGRGFAYDHQRPTSLARQQLHSFAGLPFCVPPSLHPGGTGILTCCPSPTLLSLGLGPTNPTRINLPSETLGIRRTRFSRVLRYSCRHSHFCGPHPVLSVRLVSPAERSPTALPDGKTRSFGGRLEPRYIFGARPLDQ